MKKGKFLKWAIVLVISAILFIVGKCAQAAGVEATPTPAASSTPDPWNGGFEFPDWLQTEFDYTTPSPVTPSPTVDPSLRDLVLDESDTLTPFDSTLNYGQKFCAWKSYLYNDDSSVWYFQAFNIFTSAISSSTTYRPFSSYFDNLNFSHFTTNALYFWYNNRQYNLSDSNTNWWIDCSTSNYSFSYLDHYSGSGISNSSFPSDAVSLNKRIVYFFAINKLLPRLKNSPSWFTEVGITVDMLYDLEVVPSISLTGVTDLSGTSVTYDLIYDSISLRDLYRGYTFDLDLSSIFGSSGYLTDISINFSIPIVSSNWRGLQLYRDYLSAHPEITGHVPFYFYWDGLDSGTSNGLGDFTYARAFVLSKEQDNRNWLQKLFIPSQTDLQELFDYYTPSIDSDGVFSFAANFRYTLFTWLMNPSTSDFTITLPEMHIPINGTSYTFSNSYTYNLTSSLRDLGVLQYSRLAFNFLFTVLFVNSVITMVFAVFDIHLFDGVKE